jgi:hypothetical protein
VGEAVAPRKALALGREVTSFDRIGMGDEGVTFRRVDRVIVLSAVLLPHPCVPVRALGDPVGGKRDAPTGCLDVLSGAELAIRAWLRETVCQGHLSPILTDHRVTSLSSVTSIPEGGDCLHTIQFESRT